MAKFHQIQLKIKRNKILKYFCPTESMEETFEKLRLYANPKLKTKQMIIFNKKKNRIVKQLDLETKK